MDSVDAGGVLDISVTNPHLALGNAQSRPNAFRQGYGAMLPPGAANGQHQLAFAFLNVMRDQKIQQIYI
jgi:hypothetical protein